MKKYLVLFLLSFSFILYFSCGSDDSGNDDKDAGKSDEENSDDDSYSPVCGNKMVEEGEVCDGGALACGEVDSKFTGGIATCLEDCSGYDISECKGDESDNGGENSAEVLCWDTYLCIEGCYKEENPDQCETDCLSNASSDAKDIYNTMMSCVDSNCSGASDKGECAKENCGEQINACLNHMEPAAPGTCMAIFECQQKCPQNDQSCYQSCVNQGNENGQKLYNDFVECAQACNNDQGCINEQCSEQQNACMNDK
jgi:hypothetical protein